MNPEFRRNLWLELPVRRMAFMAGALALIFFAASLSSGSWGGSWGGPGSVAVLLYYLIAVVWGSRNAALAVVGEIRMRTWDSQRLSALGPCQMMWGKLFGSTLYNWFGGAVCLAVILVDTAGNKGLAAAAIALAYYPIIGVIAQSAALLASLIAIGSDKTHSRLDVFLYQLVGLAAALVAVAVWSVSDPASAFFGHRPDLMGIGWWGMQADGHIFLLASLAAFAGWLLVGCCQLMRLELMMRNGPWVWLVFLVFVGVYTAGFDGIYLARAGFRLGGMEVRLLQAIVAFALLAYMMAFLEPKNRVLYRWMAGQFAGRHFGAAFGVLQGWTVAYVATVVCGIALICLRGMAGDGAGQAQAIAAFGFLTRDLALVVLVGMLARINGELFGVVILAALYVFMPMILDGLNCRACLILFEPSAISPLWLSPAVAWSEAALALAVAVAAVQLTMPQSEE
jgi:hypothetical protein